MILSLLGKMMDGGLELPAEVLRTGPAVEDVGEGDEESLDALTEILVPVGWGTQRSKLLVLGVDEDGEEWQEGSEVPHKYTIALWERVRKNHTSALYSKGNQSFLGNLCMYVHKITSCLIFWQSQLKLPVLIGAHRLASSITSVRASWVSTLDSSS